ncbi:hypothetical protein [Lysinibacter cavernae]|uniref:Lipoprotein n=1 Tax=Lysinibacter cavernae TaxID=1640652 RepID=A0A7X5TV28_9MICO|nr:hypothetical protein [Lysinibacter cavernae]NIH55344.1 hypothetical protein [Lysinibacter cavernae]
MTTQRLRGFAALTIAGMMALSLAGCADIKPVENEKSSSSEKKTEKPTEPATETPSSTPKASGDGSVLAPGDEVTGLGTQGSYEWFNYDEKKAILTSSLDSVEQAPQAAFDEIAEKAPELKNGYALYFLTFSTTFVSGDDIDFSANYTDFKPIDAEGNSTQTISLIGYDSCKSESFPKGFSQGGVSINNCIAAVVPAGGEAPAGMQFAQYDQATSDYDGKPIRFFK